MNKKIFKTGDIITPEFLNKVQDAIKETESEVGEHYGEFEELVKALMSVFSPNFDTYSVSKGGVTLTESGNGITLARSTEGETYELSISEEGILISSSYRGISRNVKLSSDMLSQILSTAGGVEIHDAIIDFVAPGGNTVLASIRYSEGKISFSKPISITGDIESSAWVKAYYGIDFGTWKIVNGSYGNLIISKVIDGNAISVITVGYDDAGTVDVNRKIIAKKGISGALVSGKMVLETDSNFIVKKSGANSDGNVTAEGGVTAGQGRITMKDNDAENRPAGVWMGNGQSGANNKQASMALGTDGKLYISGTNGIEAGPMAVVGNLDISGHVLLNYGRAEDYKSVILTTDNLDISSTTFKNRYETGSTLKIVNASGSSIRVTLDSGYTRDIEAYSFADFFKYGNLWYKQG